jgi:uncharacterized protein
MNTAASRPHLYGMLAGLFLSAGLCFASIQFTRTWTHLRESQVIEVTGSARRNVRSDLAIWRSQFSVEDASLVAANEKLKADLVKCEAFLRRNRITDYAFQPVQIREITARNKDEDGTTARRIGYQLTQQIAVKSKNVDDIVRLSTESAQLLNQGVAFVSNGIDFLYTQAGEAKVEMMADATRDARTRADQIALQGKRRVKELRSAHMGVVQINPVFSSATSWEGNNDTSSIDKTIIATVGATFALE